MPREASSRSLRPGPPSAVRALRILTVVVLALGIIAMHQLGGGSHAGHGAATATATDGAVAMPTGSMPGAEMAAPAPGVSASSAVLTAARDHRLGAIGLACLGILPVLLALALPAIRSGIAASDRPRRGVLGGRTSPPGRGPPRTLLAQLCVLRT